MADHVHVDGPMCGGFKHQEVTEEDQHIVDNLIATINQRLGTNVAGFKVVCADSQIVAGKNMLYHLTDPEHNKYTVKIYLPLS